MFTYEELLPIGSLLMITSASFFLGVLFANWPYNYYTLWDPNPSDAMIARTLTHYINWVEVPKAIPYTMYGILFVGFLGAFIKIFKPSEDVKYFEYGSLLLYVLAACCYITNVRVGAFSAKAAEWGEVDERTGLAVIGASEVIIVFILAFLVVLQCGLFFAQNEDNKVKAAFLLKELKVKVARAEAYEASQKSQNSDGKLNKVSNSHPILSQIPLTTNPSSILHSKPKPVTLPYDFSQLPDSIDKLVEIIEENKLKSIDELITMELNLIKKLKTIWSDADISAFNEWEKNVRKALPGYIKIDGSTGIMSPTKKFS